MLFTGAILALQVGFNIVAVKEDISEFAVRIHFSLVVKMGRVWIALQATYGDCLGTQRAAELHNSDKAIAAGAIHTSGTRVGAGTERGQGTPSPGIKPYWYAGFVVVEVLHQVTGYSLIAIYLTPGDLPGAEILSESLCSIGKCTQQLIRGSIID